LPVRILIADDSAPVRRSIRHLLEGNPDWEICGEACNGQDAIDKAIELTPDIIVLDLAMPVMDGLQAARRIAVMAPKVPTVMFTNYSSEELKSQAFGAGVHMVLPKFEGAALIETIESLLRKRTLSRV
jgi:DNA-binding NarL/FixJ family response regulator